jgi:hypothetical protein
MIQIMSQEAQRAWAEEQVALEKSPSLEDQGVAIMMNSNIAGWGHKGDEAREKVRALFKLWSRFGGSPT